VVAMTHRERQYRMDLYAVIQASVAANGGASVVGGRCGMRAQKVSLLGATHLPSLRVLLRVATACNTTPAAWLAEAERRSWRYDVWDELSPFFGRFAGDDFGA
jgi:hypothetical protein